jgi:hypothetical protein
MRDIPAEYKRLIRIELLDLLEEQMDRINGKTRTSLHDSVQKYADRIYDISKADFEDNFNYSHAEEQNHERPF